MNIGILKEIKAQEYRVAGTPSLVKELVSNGHTVLIEEDAGIGSGFSNSLYYDAGAKLIKDKKKIYDTCDLLLKVKEPIEEEFSYFKDGQTIFTYLHLAAHPKLATFLLKKNITGIAYEAIEENGHFPLLTPMSEIAGRLSILEGAKYLQRTYGGKGILLSGTSTVEPAHVLIIGAGIVGTQAAIIAAGLQAKVTIMDISETQLEKCKQQINSPIETVISTPDTLSNYLSKTDLIIGAVLNPGKRAPIIIKNEHLKLIKKGSVIVDVAIDQGGCCETSKPTTHENPVFSVDGVIHYCVSNMPGSVPFTGTNALCKASTPYIKTLATMGVDRSIKENKPIKKGIITYKGNMVNEIIGTSLSLPYDSLT